MSTARIAFLARTDSALSAPFAHGVFGLADESGDFGGRVPVFDRLFEGQSLQSRFDPGEAVDDVGKWVRHVGNTSEWHVHRCGQFARRVRRAVLAGHGVREGGVAAGIGEVREFRVVAPYGDTTHRATNHLGVDGPDPAGVRRTVLGDRGVLPRVEAVHRRGAVPVGAEQGLRNDIGRTIRAFVRVEYLRSTTGVSWFAVKVGIIHEAVRADLTNPWYRLPAGATA